MYFEISDPHSIKIFIKFLKTFITSSLYALLVFDNDKVYLINNYKNFSSFQHSDLVLISSFNPDFFSKFFFPHDKYLAFEIDLQPIYKNIYNIKKLLEKIEFKITLGVQNDRNHLLEIYLDAKSYNLKRNQQVRMVLDFDLQDMGTVLPGNKKHKWLKLIEIESEDAPNLIEFKNFALNITFNDNFLFLKSLNNPRNIEMTLNERIMIDYNCEQITKNLKKKNKIILEANRLISYVQLCKELKKNIDIMISFDEFRNEENNILCKISTNYYSILFNFVVFAETCEKSNIQSLLNNIPATLEIPTNLIEIDDKQEIKEESIVEKNHAHEYFLSSLTNFKKNPISKTKGNDDNNDYILNKKIKTNFSSYNVMKEESNLKDLTNSKFEKNITGDRINTQKSNIMSESSTFSSKLHGFTTNEIIKNKDYLNKFGNFFKN